MNAKGFGRLAAGLVCGVLIWMTAAAARAADKTFWKCNPAVIGDWADPTNWDNGVPGDHNDAFVDNGGTAVISSGDYEVEITVGEDHAGTVKQTGGIVQPRYIWLGKNAGASGTYTFTGGVIRYGGVSVGSYGQGHFTQDGGTIESMTSLNVGYLVGSEGTYVLRDGSIQAKRVRIGHQGQGHFIHSGGTLIPAEPLLLAWGPGARGTYELSGTGVLSVVEEVIGSQGVGIFTQTGGTHTVSEQLQMGEYGGSEGTYELAAGSLRAPAVHVGTDGTGLFRQSGGAHACDFLYVNSTSRYELTGGVLQVAKRASISGELDFAGSGAGLHVGTGATLDCSGGTILRSANASITAEANTLVAFPSGFDPNTQLAGYSSQGLTHVAGTTLVVPAGQGFTGYEDFKDHVQCHGTIGHAEDDKFNLHGGLEVFPGGKVDLGHRSELRVDDEESGMTGGELSAHYERIGYNGTGAFVQTGGRNAAQIVSCGYNTGSHGTYEMKGGQLEAGVISPGSSRGRGVFRHTGGTVTVESYIYCGSPSHAPQEDAGTYELSGNAVLSAPRIVVGDYGPGFFEQNGGTNTIGEFLWIGSAGMWAAPGAYELNGGLLSVPETRIGTTSTGRFTQSGGRYTGGYVDIDDDSKFELTGGHLVLSVGMDAAGDFDFKGGSGTLTVGEGAFVNFSGGTLRNASGTTVTAGRNSLIVFPAGFDPDRDLGSYSTAGVTHFAGTTLVVPTGQHVKAWRTIYDRVECHGSMVAGKDEDLILLGGVEIRDGGRIDTGELGEMILESGTSVMDSGELSCAYQVIGEYGSARFVQTGGTNTASGPVSDTGLIVGRWSGSSGTYEMSGGQLTCYSQYIGGRDAGGTGRFVQTGGTNSAGVYFKLGTEPEAAGTYELGGTGVLETNDQQIGAGGVFKQYGGRNVANGYVILSRGGDDGAADYEISGGELLAWGIRVGSEKPAIFRQTGGKVDVGSVALADYYWGGHGTYELTGGELRTGRVLAGHTGIGTFIHDGGIHTVTDYLTVGHGGRGGSYEFRGGRLTAAREIIARHADATFVQTGGTHTVEGGLFLGFHPGVDGVYTMSDGTLRVGRLVISENDDPDREAGFGWLNIASPAAGITISELFRLGRWSGLSAAPGSAIHMTGSAFRNESTDPTLVAGLKDLTLIFEGGPGDVDPFEVAGRDLGAEMEGFDAGFVLGRLEVGGRAGVGRIRLVDDFDNQRNWDGPEALYVRSLQIGPDSYLDLNGLNLYYLSGSVDPAAVLPDGRPIWVPEPAAVSVLAVGALWLLRRRRRRSGPC